MISNRFAKQFLAVSLVSLFCYAGQVGAAPPCSSAEDSFACALGSSGSNAVTNMGPLAESVRLDVEDLFDTGSVPIYIDQSAFTEVGRFASTSGIGSFHRQRVTATPVWAELRNLPRFSMRGYQEMPFMLRQTGDNATSTMVELDITHRGTIRGGSWDQPPNIDVIWAVEITDVANGSRVTRLDNVTNLFSRNEPRVIGEAEGQMRFTPCDRSGCYDYEFRESYQIDLNTDTEYLFKTDMLGSLDIRFLDEFDFGLAGDISRDSTVFRLSKTTDNVDFSAVVPVPAAAWLFASGLLGLIGVMRKNA